MWGCICRGCSFLHPSREAYRRLRSGRSLRQAAACCLPLLWRQHRLQLLRRVGCVCCTDLADCLRCCRAHALFGIVRAPCGRSLPSATTLQQSDTLGLQGRQHLQMEIHAPCSGTGVFAPRGAKSSSSEVVSSGAWLPGPPCCPLPSDSSWFEGFSAMSDHRPLEKCAVAWYPGQQEQRSRLRVLDLPCTLLQLASAGRRALVDASLEVEQYRLHWHSLLRPKEHREAGRNHSGGHTSHRDELAALPPGAPRLPEHHVARARKRLAGCRPLRRIRQPPHDLQAARGCLALTCCHMCCKIAAAYPRDAEWQLYFTCCPRGSS